MLIWGTKKNCYLPKKTDTVMCMEYFMEIHTGMQAPAIRRSNDFTHGGLAKACLTALLLLVVAVSSAFSGAVRIMPLGDSITAGSNSGVVDDAFWIAYRKDLYNRLVGGRYAVNFVGSQVNGSGAGLTDSQHEGHPGWSADGAPGESIRPAVRAFLTANPAEIVLLHIGTNDISSGQSPADIRDEVAGILDEIDAYEQSTRREVWVVLALIVKRAIGCPLRDQTVTLNNLLDAMVQDRLDRPESDRIAVVDMEAALTDYTIGGDMYDCIHPRSTGYTKIGAAWYQELIGILPTANAGSDKSVNPGALVSLDGSRSSDSLGTIITYAWTQTGGSPAARLDNPASKVAKFTAPSVSGGTTLTFKLTITDDREFSHNDQVQVVVNGPPVAVAGPDQEVNANATVTLDATGSSDPGGAIDSFRWTQTAGSPVVTLAGGATAKASFKAPEVGSGGVDLVFKLTVTDNKGATAEDSLVVHVNGPPVADAGADQQVDPGATVRLDGSHSFDPDGSVGAYSWAQLSGPAVVLSGSASPQASFTAPLPAAGGAELVFKLTVTDNRGATAADTLAVRVNLPPVADAGADQRAESGATVLLDGTHSLDPDGTISAYLWAQTSGPAVVLSGGASPQASFTAPAVSAAAALTFELTVTDNSGRSSRDTSTVTVAPGADPGAPDGGSGSSGGGGGGCFITVAGL
jgi:lysophospholipase L1-like esterase